MFALYFLPSMLFLLPHRQQNELHDVCDYQIKHISYIFGSYLSNILSPTSLNGPRIIQSSLKPSYSDVINILVVQSKVFTSLPFLKVNNSLETLKYVSSPLQEYFIYLIFTITYPQDNISVNHQHSSTFIKCTSSISYVHNPVTSKAYSPIH